MRFNVGDRVRFLNEKGGGVVSKIISSNLVQVAIEDGFEIPTLTSELVRVEDEEQIKDYYDRTAEAPMTASGESSTAETSGDRVTQIVRYPSRQDFQQGVYLAFVPQDQKWLITGMLDIYLVNFTDYDVLFSLFLKEKDGGYAGTDYDAVSPQSKCLLDTIGRDDLEVWSQGIIQTLFHQDHPQKILSPGSTTFRIRPVKFVREANYIQPVFLAEKALLVTIHSIEALSDATAEDKEITAGKEMPPAPAKPAVAPALIDRHRIGARIAEVDLHISALKDDYKDLKSHEILQIQTDYFMRTLESAIENHYYKVFFIHGVGNGILKARIMDHLAEYYEDIECRDAPFETYGVGAVEVVIYENV